MISNNCKIKKKKYKPTYCKYNVSMQNNGAIQAGFDNATTDAMGLKSTRTPAVHTFGNLSARQELAEKTLVLTKSESGPGFLCDASL